MDRRDFLKLSGGALAALGADAHSAKAAGCGRWKATPPLPIVHM